MPDSDDTANPSAKPPPEPQQSVHAQPVDPADGDAPAPNQGDDTSDQARRDRERE